MIWQCAQFTAAAINPTFPPPLVCAHHHCECSDYTPEGGFRCELRGSFQPEASVREEKISCAYHSQRFKTQVRQTAP